MALSAPIPPQHQSLLSELSVAGGQVATLLRSGMARVVHPTTLGWAGLVLSMWLIGIAGDAYTTLAMMATGLFEEGNSVAAAGMGVLGPAGYTVAASVVCLGFAVLNVGRPTRWHGRLMVAVLTVTAGIKVYTAASNALLWIAG